WTRIERGIVRAPWGADKRALVIDPDAALAYPAAMESHASPWRSELRAQVRLAGPVALVQVGLYAMGAVDAAFMGRVSEVEFGAVALGHSVSFAFLGVAMGTLTALDPIVAQAHGAGEDEAVARALQRGVVLAL